MKRTMKVISVLGTAAGLLVVLSFVGCSTFNSLLSQAVRGAAGTSGETNGSQPAAQSSGETGTAPAAKSTAQPSSAGGASIQAMQAQFYAAYSMALSFGGFKTGEAGYRPGQGTVWELKGGSSGNRASTVEHALLKINTDDTQWWRLELTSEGDTMLYEFLLAGGDTVQKVRFKDPDSGKIVEFIPNQSQGGAVSPGAAGPVGVPPETAGGAGQGKVTKGQETITVKAGTFQTEHVTYADNQGNFKSESWTSQGVPGGLVKMVSTNLRSGQEVHAELVKIESGVTTVLQSY